MKSVKLVAVVEPFEKRRLEMAEDANCPGYATLEEALADTSITIDGVLVCAPTGEHYKLVKVALNGGKPVFCEKPVAQTIAEVDELYTLAKEKNLPLLCGFQRRFDPSFVKLKKSLESGQVGTLEVIRTTSRDHPLPSFEFLKTSGGIMHDCASHDIDVHRWLANEDPEEVYCVGQAFFPEIKAMGDYDVVVIVLKFPSGITGTIDLMRNATYGYDQRIEVLGSKGMVQANNKPMTTHVLSNESGVLSDTINYSFGDRYPDAYKGEIEHFVEILRDPSTPLRVTHQDVRRTGLIADAADESARTGKPVKLVYE